MEVLLAASGIQNGSTNGNLGSLPELPHVTNNIIPLSNVLRFYTQEAYKQLSRLIENLANTKTSESDIARKKKFLEVIVSLRKDFLKIYTLVKWAQNSRDVSKLIDLLNFFRTQEFYFENLGHGLNELNNFSGAKLPDSDIFTALELLVKGRPQLPSYNFILKPPVSPEKVLEVLKDLNLTLTARMALIKEMPLRFNNNYEIKDGRVIITIPNEFQVSITVGNDEIIENNEDYPKSPFFFIDFAFLFGINPDTGLITHKDSRIITRLPEASRSKLETAMNQVLLTQSLTGLYDSLHKYSISFKLYLISRQLRDLSVNSKWKNNIQFKYSSSLIIINYWSKNYFSKEWKSFIEIGIDHLYNLNFRWFKNGKYNLNHNIESITGNYEDEAQDLSVDWILSLIINKHSEILMHKIFEQLLEQLPPEACSSINPYQLLIQLTPKKSTILAINPLTGFFYFMDPSPIQAQIQNKINSPPYTSKSTLFISEREIIANVVKYLIQLRLESLSETLNNQLITTEWIANDIIKFNDAEVSKLYESLQAEDTNVIEQANSPRKVQFYRCRNWPTFSFLISLISGVTLKTYWWVSRLKSIKGEWRIQWMQVLKPAQEDELTYSFFKNLSKSGSNLIVDHIIVEELQSRKVKYLNFSDESALSHFNLPFTLESSPSRYESVFVLFNHGNLLPVAVSSTSLFLRVRLSSDDVSTKMGLSIWGSLKNISQSDIGVLEKLNVNILSDKEKFEILALIDFSRKLIESSETDGTHNLLNQLFGHLEKVDLLVRMLYQLKKTDIYVTTTTVDQLAFTIDPVYEEFHLKLPANDQMQLQLTTGDHEEDSVKVLTKFLNKQIAESHDALVGSIRYLKEFAPVISSMKKVRNYLLEKKTPKLANKLSKLQLEIKFQHLNSFQFIFYHNSINPSTPKKTQKDRISFAMSYARNKFDAEGRLFLKFSMKENLNSQNLKYKPLFEMIFKAVGELQQELQKGSEKGRLMKLNYDFLLDQRILETLLLKITDCFLNYILNES